MSSCSLLNIAGPETWAAKNNLKIHPNKTKEMLIFRRRTSRAKYSSEPIIPGAERVETLRVLKVTLNSRLAMGDHIDRVIGTCAYTRFALRTLRSLGLRPLELHLVARMTSVASLMYASPAWWGFRPTDAAARTRLNRPLASLRRAGYLPVDFPSFAELARLADDSLFRSISSNPDYVLRHYFKDKNPTGHNLHPRGHNFALPRKDTCNFVSRILYAVLL